LTKSYWCSENSSLKLNYDFVKQFRKLILYNASNVRYKKIFTHLYSDLQNKIKVFYLEDKNFI